MKKALLSIILSVAAISCGAKVLRDIPYDPAIGSAGLGDLYLPDAGNGEMPVVLAIHGGGWARGDRKSMAGVAEFLYRDLGCAVFNIEYRLAGRKNHWPACGDDCVKAANWLFSADFRQHAGFSPEKIYICGVSAGGHLSLWTLVNLPTDKVAGCISISAVGDPTPDLAHHPRRYVALFGKDVDENDLSAMNPIPKIKSGMAPLLCSHATKDRVVSIVSHRAFADAYRAAGNACEFFEYPNSIREGLTGHCIWIPDSDPQRLIPEIEARIKAFFAQPVDKAPAVVSTEIKILEPAQGAVVPLLTDAQKAYFDIPTAERRIKFRDIGFRKQLARSGERAPDGSVVRQAYWPKTVRLAWTPVKGADAYTVTVKDAKKGETVVNETVAGTSLEIDNLEVAAEYVWTVSGGGDTGKGMFKTEDRTPRFIRYPGVPNVRDLGGWIGLDGRRVRQGMIIRSAGLNENAHREKVDSDATEKPEGKPKMIPGKSRVEGENGAYILKRFGIKSEVDLRSKKECFGMEGSPLGPSVKWFHYSASAYSGMQGEHGREAFTKVFKVFLDEKNYPIDFHCIAGQDRTGSVAYVLEALLGADEDHLMRDWETTAFWNRNVTFAHVERYDKLVEGFKQSFPADTVRGRVEKYVLSLGFTPEDIEIFRGIMLEEKESGK